MDVKLLQLLLSREQDIRQKKKKTKAKIAIYLAETEVKCRFPTCLRQTTAGLFLRFLHKVIDEDHTVIIL